MTLICDEAGCDRPTIGRGLCSPHYQKAKYHDRLPPRRIPRGACEHCGADFEGIRRNSRFCSRQCMSAAKYLRKVGPTPQRDCEQCGTSLAGMTRKARFCSTGCAQTFRNTQVAQARWAEIDASRSPCRGCLGEIPAGRYRHAEYCSDACKIRSRRHETYGLTKAELDILLSQHAVCAICNTGHWGRKGPQVDHCHETGRDPRRALHKLQQRARPFRRRP